MSLSRREQRPLGPDRRGDGGRRMRNDAGGTPGTVRGEVVSKSVAKASRSGIDGEKKHGIATFLLREGYSAGS